MSRLDLVVGPNGAGKTSYIASILAPALSRSVIVNADEIAKHRWPDDPASYSYEAAEIAASTRSRLIAERRAFIAETVFSHPSKLDLVAEAQAARFHVALHVVMIPTRLAPHRVAARVAAGGHDVPVEKIVARAERLWALVARAVGEVDTAVFLDNSMRSGPVRVASFIGGAPAGRTTWPAWTSADLTTRWPSR